MAGEQTVEGGNTKDGVIKRLADLHPLLRFAATLAVAGLVIAGGLGFTAETVARAAAEMPPPKSNVRASYMPAKVSAQVDDLNIARATPVTPVAESVPPAAAPQPKAFTHSVNAASLRVRSGPHTTSRQLFALAGGTPVNLIRSEGGWMMIATDDGRQGWVYGKFLDETRLVAAAE